MSESRRVLALETIKTMLSNQVMKGTGQYRFGIKGDIEAAMNWHRETEGIVGLSQIDRLYWLIEYSQVAPSSLEYWLEERVLEVFESSFANAEHLSTDQLTELSKLNQQVSAEAEKINWEEVDYVPGVSLEKLLPTYAKAIIALKKYKLQLAHRVVATHRAK